jgi:hypothetical protein
VRHHTDGLALGGPSREGPATAEGRVPDGHAVLVTAAARGCSPPQPSKHVTPLRRCWVAASTW